MRESQSEPVREFESVSLREFDSAPVPIRAIAPGFAPPPRIDRTESAHRSRAQRLRFAMERKRGYPAGDRPGGRSTS